MKNWPLRWKVALYSAWLALAATVGGAVTTWFVLHYAKIAAFDRRLTTDAQEFFRDVEHFEGGGATNRRVFREIFVPLSLRKHLVEVTDASGTVLYLSPRLRQPFPRDGIKKFHNHQIDGQNIRLAELMKMASPCAPVMISRRSIKPAMIFCWRCWGRFRRCS